ncbi:VanZ family protein [Terrisporobacter sp.]
MKKCILTVLLILGMLFIFSMSSQNGQKSSNTSKQTIRVVLSLVPGFEKQSEDMKEKTVEKLQFITRKSAHFTAYMILGILTTLLILQFENIQKKPQWAFLICVLYAASDEFHQLFVPGRAGQLRDVLIDSSGSILGIVIVLLCVKFLQRKKYKIKSV